MDDAILEADLCDQSVAVAFDVEHCDSISQEASLWVAGHHILLGQPARVLDFRRPRLQGAAGVRMCLGEIREQLLADEAHRSVNLLVPK